ncbi:hypothetical protein OsI_32233 [Oryza sativa Indica Group]|uniref:DUF632 domain-containing protein n=1 Tax=Oryza sativa subsp. indica TaxID=39946 RepID=A2Z3M3_ORYSI|nr:hypothetical protein OsI_32233 [Oryza sativa Indica Group]
MGNCAASRLAGGGGGGGCGDPVAVCRDRKRLIKAAADRRFALAGAHAAYAAALRSVADAEVAAAAISDEEMRAVREREGIPELEEAEEEDDEGAKSAAAANAKTPKAAETSLGVTKQEEAKDVCEVASNNGGRGGGLEVAVSQPGRELLAALKEIEELFARAAEAGKEVTAMLEAASRVPELKENSSKIIHAITWHRSPSSVSSSYRSELGASSNSLSWTDKSETKSDIFDDYGGMKSGSHSQTLGRLYAWEKKLYEEVKAVDQIRQTYEKKCVQLRNQDTKGSELRCAEKTRTTVRDLYTRIWVSLRAAESISDRIQKLRDEELQPQLVELLQGLTRTWKIMVDSHETQRQIMFEVNSFTCPAYGKFCNDAQRHATLKLEAELRNWRSCFMIYVSAQKAYIEALDGWLSKFILTDTIRYSRGISSIAPDRSSAPPLVVICHDWYTTLSKFQNKRVAFTMRNFIRSVRVLWLKQGEEQQQKRKVDSLAKEMDKKISAYKRAENKVIETKLLEHRPEQDAKQRMEHLSEKKEMLNVLRKRVEAEKAKHHACMRDTHDVTLNGFKIGLASIFESLTEFSKDSVKLYEDLLTHAEPKGSEDATEKRPCVEGPYSQISVDAT